MAKMNAAQAAVLVMEKEGVTQAFGVPGAAINPLYAALRKHGGISHIVARHVEGASHMAEGYTRARAGNIGVCIGTSGPAGTDMITGLYSAVADSIPILCITGQAPRARLYKEDFQAVDIESISKPVTKWSVTVCEPAQVPRAFQQAFHLMRSGRPGPVLIDLPFDVQTTEIEFDIDTYEPLPVYKPAASKKQMEKAFDMLMASDFVMGIGNRWANRHTGSTEVYTKGRKFVHVDIEPTQIGRVFAPDYGVVSDAKAALIHLVAIARERAAAAPLKNFTEWAERCAERKTLMLRKTHYTETPIKPLRVYEEMNKAFGRDTIYVSTIGLSQIAGAQFLNVYGPRQWINCGQAGPLGWTIPAALGVVAADPTRTVVGLSGDYDFQFLIEELAVGAQFRLPYVQVPVNNSYLGLIRQSQRFEMNYCVQLAFENQNVPESEGDLRGYGVDHLANVAMGTEIDKINEFEAIDCRHPEGQKGLELAGLLE